LSPQQHPDIQKITNQITLSNQQKDVGKDKGPARRYSFSVNALVNKTDLIVDKDYTMG